MSVNARDRNRLAFQGDLLAAYSSGVRELLLTTGADPSAGDQPMTGRCQDMGLDVMLQCISAMRIGRDLGGEPLDAPCDFRTGVCLGVSSDAAANRRTAEGIGRLAELGIQYVVPAPTYDMDVVSMFADAGRGAGISVHPSVLLLKSVAMIRYLNNLPDASPMPDGLLKRMMKAPDKLRCGMEIAAEFILSLKDRCGGALLVSVGWDSRLKEFLEMLASAGAP
jgi:5,10-methylenetetrahydrofolate reductase